MPGPGHHVWRADSPAYTAAQKELVSMLAHGESAWEFERVTRPTVLPLTDTFCLIGLKGVCVQPVGGDCGNRVDCDQIR